MADMSVEEARDLLAGVDEGGFSGSDGGEFAVEGEGEGASAVVSDMVEQAGVGVGGQVYDENAVGLGVDIVEIERMKAILARTSSFAERVFSPDERAYCDGMANPATHYALRFAAKEAVVKALGTGFAGGIGVRDIEVKRAKGGRPIAVLSGRALEIAQEQGVRELSISLSYTHTDAVACAMAVTDASVRATEKRKDPMEELAKQFKEVRGMLDDL